LLPQHGICGVVNRPMLMLSIGVPLVTHISRMGTKRAVMRFRHRMTTYVDDLIRVKCGRPGFPKMAEQKIIKHQGATSMNINCNGTPDF